MSDEKTSVTSMSSSEVWVDGGGVQVINESPYSGQEIAQAMFDQHPNLGHMARLVASQLSSWTGGTTMSSRGRATSLFERDKYVTPMAIADQMRVAAYAMRHDDTVGGVEEISESLAFNRMAFESEDTDQEDAWNQIAADLDLDSRIREMWRELFSVSQFYACMFWGTKTYRIRGKADKRKKRKEFTLKVPLSMGLLDPLKVVPVGNLMFGQEQLAYVAGRAEAAAIDEVLAGQNTSDLVVMQFITGAYNASRDERQLLESLGFDAEHLYLLNPKAVWRHTLTRPQYERFSDVRMVSIMELLDLKNMLRQADRSALAGATNFIVLIKIGSDELPAKQAEIAAMTGAIQTASRVPVIIGDHRLSIEIITPKNDTTLDAAKHNTVDARITSRLLNIMFIGNFQGGARGDDSIKLAKVIGRSLESRRTMLRRALEKHVIKPIFDANAELDGDAWLRFYPKRIALDFDPSVAAMITDLHNTGDLSRQTALSELDFDQREEALKRQREKDEYDSIFQTAVPFNSPANNPTGNPANNPANPQNPGQAKTQQKQAGRNQGGNRNGGGAVKKAQKPVAAELTSEMVDEEEELED